MKPALALIITKQSSLQNGLLALLTTIPQISAVLVAEDAASGLRMLKNHQPILLLLDMELPEDDAQTILKQIEAQWPGIRCIALTDSVQQKQAAETLEVDAVLFTGFSAAKLIAVIEELLSQQDSDEPTGLNT
jgi:DNA-binding NarL/FixJ family response regulator